MSIINFSMLDPNSNNLNTIQLKGRIYYQKLHKNKASRWIFIPTEIKKLLNLTRGLFVYFYLVDQQTLVMSFRDPGLKTAKRRTISYNGNSKENLTIVLPTSLINKDVLHHAVGVQIINPTGSTNYEWQLRLV